MGGNSVTRGETGQADRYEAFCRAVALASAGSLTHHQYSMVVAKAALCGVVLRPFVQVSKRGAVLCGRVDSLGDHGEGGDWFKVSTDLGLGWYQARNVRLCSGDGRCQCECDATASKGFPVVAPPPRVSPSTPQGVGFFQAGVVAPPERCTAAISPEADPWADWARSSVRRMRRAGQRIG